MQNSSTIMTSSSALKSPRRLKMLAVLGLMAGTILTPVSALAADLRVRVQLENYEGDEAYFALYLVNPEARYETTLWVSGDEAKWYPDMPRWWRYLARKPQELDAITGASTAGGDRSIARIEIADELIDAGYILRVETAVEDLENYDKDVEVELTSANAGEKIPGTGYVRALTYKF